MSVISAARVHFGPLYLNLLCQQSHSSSPAARTERKQEPFAPWFAYPALYDREWQTWAPYAVCAPQWQPTLITTNAVRRAASLSRECPIGNTSSSYGLRPTTLMRRVSAVSVAGVHPNMVATRGIDSRVSAVSAARAHPSPKLKNDVSLSAACLASGRCSSEIDLKPCVYRSRERFRDGPHSSQVHEQSVERLSGSTYPTEHKSLGRPGSHVLRFTFGSDRFRQCTPRERLLGSTCSTEQSVRSGGMGGRVNASSAASAHLVSEIPLCDVGRVSALPGGTSSSRI